MPGPRAVADQWEQAAHRPDADMLIHPSGTDPDAYRESGRQAARNLVGMVAKQQATAHRWLDYGCGNGRVLHALGGIVHEAHGYDTSPTLVAQARDQGCWATTHIASLKPPYDVTFALAVLIHHSHAGATSMLETMVDLTAPGGLVIFDVPVHTELHEGTDWIDVTVWTADMLDSALATLPVEVIRSDRHDEPFTYGTDRPQTHILRRT